jgi:hypothetical protein
VSNQELESKSPREGAPKLGFRRLRKGEVEGWIGWDEETQEGRTRQEREDPLAKIASVVRFWVSWNEFPTKGAHH